METANSEEFRINSSYLKNIQTSCFTLFMQDSSETILLAVPQGIQQELFRKVIEFSLNKDNRQYQISLIQNTLCPQTYDSQEILNLNSFMENNKSDPTLGNLELYQLNQLLNILRLFTVIKIKDEDQEVLLINEFIKPMVFDRFQMQGNGLIANNVWVSLKLIDFISVVYQIIVSPWRREARF